MRRTTCEVRIGRTTIGGGHPVACQSMTNTDTNDTAASVAQIERIDRAGGKIVRLTAQGRREGENLENIVRQLRADGFRTAVVADIHFCLLYTSAMPGAPIQAGGYLWQR